MIGLDPAAVPRNRAELAASFEEMRPSLAVSREAREALLQVLNPPTPLFLLPLRLAGSTLLALGLGSLPRWAHRLYGLPALPVTEPAVSFTLRALRRATFRCAAPHGRSGNG